MLEVKENNVYICHENQKQIFSEEFFILLSSV